MTAAAYLFLCLPLLLSLAARGRHAESAVLADQPVCNFVERRTRRCRVAWATGMKDDRHRCPLRALPLQSRLNALPRQVRHSGARNARTRNLEIVDRDSQVRNCAP
jgi:hypothetical protein